MTGPITEELVTKLTPRILLLQHKSRDPITVYIDSPGGLVSSAETILRLLNLSDQDQADSCEIITAVTSQAASAAADLLSSGDYAVAFPTSTILHHGVRQMDKNPSTLESASMLSETLRLSNDIYANQLAQKIEDRFTYRYLLARAEFDELRETKGSPNLSELDCFIEYIEGKLSQGAKKLWTKAKNRHERYRALFASVTQSREKLSAIETPLAFEAEIIKSIVDFEVNSNDPGDFRSFRFRGMRRLVDDFFLVNEYLTSTTSQRLAKWCTSFGKLILTEEQETEIEAISDDEQREKRLNEIGAPILQPILSFFGALCHALQEGENEFTATDAYWLGLVDEVLGLDLWTIRSMEEFVADPSEETEEHEQTDTTTTNG